MYIYFIFINLDGCFEFFFSRNRKIIFCRNKSVSFVSGKWELPIFPLSDTQSLHRMEPHISYQKVKVFPKCISIFLYVWQTNFLTSPYWALVYVLIYETNQPKSIIYTFQLIVILYGVSFSWPPESIFAVTLPLSFLQWIKPMDIWKQ